MDFNTFCSKNLVLACLQIHFGKPYFERELSKPWRILPSDQILEEASRLE